MLTLSILFYNFAFVFSLLSSSQRGGLSGILLRSLVRKIPNPFGDFTKICRRNPVSRLIFYPPHYTMPKPQTLFVSLFFSCCFFPLNVFLKNLVVIVVHITSAKILYVFRHKNRKFMSIEEW